MTGRKWRSHNLREQYPQASAEGQALVKQMRPLVPQLTPRPKDEPQNSARAENSQQVEGINRD